MIAHIPKPLAANMGKAEASVLFEPRPLAKNQLLQWIAMQKCQPTGPVSHGYTFGSFSHLQFQLSSSAATHSQKQRCEISANTLTLTLGLSV